MSESHYSYDDANIGTTGLSIIYDDPIEQLLLPPHPLLSQRAVLGLVHLFPLIQAMGQADDIFDLCAYEILLTERILSNLIFHELI
jgi:hypothetical protein